MKSSWHGSKSTTSRKNPKSPVRETPGSSPAPPRPIGAAVIPSNYNHHSQAARRPGQPSSAPACKIRVSSVLSRQVSPWANTRGGVLYSALRLATLGREGEQVSPPPSSSALLPMQEESWPE